MYAALDCARIVLALPQCLAGIPGIEGGALTQELLGALVPRIGHLQDHVDNLVAARSFAGIHHAALAQPELLIVLGARRDLQQSLAVYGRDFNLGAESRLGNGDRDLQMDVVPDAAEQWML